MRDTKGSTAGMPRRRKRSACALGVDCALSELVTFGGTLGRR